MDLASQLYAGLPQNVVLHLVDIFRIFSTWQHVCHSMLYAISCPSVRLSGCVSHRWISQKWL